MNDRPSAPGSSDDELTTEREVPDESHDAALMREVMREQERHREGGVDPELAEDDGGAGSEG